LEPDVAVVEVRPGHADWDVDLVVEEVCRWDWPLRNRGCTIAEWRDGHGEAVPVLEDINQLLLLIFDLVDGPTMVTLLAVMSL